jgi:O-antigen/teichoic acid export membrane protein
MIVPMQVLAVFGVLRSIRTCASPLFRALGQPDYPAKIHAIRLCVMIVTIYPLTVRFGLPGTALSVLLTSAVGIPIATLLTMRLLDDDLRSLVASVGFPMAGSLLMGICALAVRQVVTETAGTLTTFVATVLTGVAVYALFIITVDRYFEIGLKEFLGQLKQSL